MLEYIYKLNLPNIEEIILPDKYREIFAPTSKEIRFSYHQPNSFLKEEHLTFKHYRWDSSLLFYKNNGAVGVLHSDLPKASWAINYITAGKGIMQYYDNNVIGPGTMIPDNLGNFRLVWDMPTVGPTKVYTMTHGVYLVRVDIPHIVTGYDNRYALSIRSFADQGESWDTVVNNFCEYFI